MPRPFSAADLPKRLRPDSLGLANGGRDAIDECVSPGRGSRYRASLGEFAIAERLSASLGGGQSDNRRQASKEQTEPLCPQCVLRR